MANTDLAPWLEAIWRHYNEIVDRLAEMAQALQDLRHEVKALNQELPQKKSGD